MSSRNRAARHYHEPPRGPYSRGLAPPQRSHPSALQEELDVLYIDLRRLTADNRAILEDRAALQCELEAGKEELHRLGLLMTEIRSEKEAYIKELVEKARLLEAELRDMQLLREDVRVLRGEVERVTVGKKEMAVRLESLTKDISRAHTKNEQTLALTDELDAVTEELMRARNTIEAEKKANMEIEEQKSSMEKNMVGMAREIDELRAELANTEARAWGPPGVAPYRRIRSSPGLFLPPYSGPYHLTPGVAERGPMYAEYDRHSRRGP